MCWLAAGNVVDPRAQVTTAAGAGSAAAVAMNADVVDDDVGSHCNTKSPPPEGSRHFRRDLEHVATGGDDERPALPPGWIRSWSSRRDRFR